MSSLTTVLITGANSGIGYQTALQLLRSSTDTYQILVGARSLEKSVQAIEKLKAEEKESNSQLLPLVVDLEADISINKAYEEVKEKSGKLDVLVNNAGALLDSSAKQDGLTTRQLFDKSFSINVTGTHVLTEAFAPLLIQSSNPRIIFLGTSMASLSISEYPQPYFNHPPEAGWPKPNPDFWAYKSSKLALVMIMRDWYKTLRNDKVKVWAINPGLVKTNLGGNPEFLESIGAGDAYLSGGLIKDTIEGKRDHDVGKMIALEDDIFGAVVPW